MTERFSQELVDLTMNKLVGSLEQELKNAGYDIGSGAEASKVVHAFWDAIVVTALKERAQGHELY